MVVRMLSRLERVHNSRGRGRGSAVHSSDEEGKDYTADHLNINSQYCMKDFLIYLKAMQLLLARYHPELHSVTPLHALCGILMKGVSAIFTLSRIAADMKGMKARRNNSGSGGEDKGGSESESKPAVDPIPAPIQTSRKSGTEETTVSLASIALASPPPSPLPTHTTDVLNSTDDLDLDELLEDTHTWVNTTLSVLQNRLSGPISRDDWTDFVTAGGADSLCVLLTSPFFSVFETAFEKDRSSVDEVTEDEDELKGNDTKLNLSVLKLKKNGDTNASVREEEALVLSAQLLQNLVLSSSSKYAMVSGSVRESHNVISLLSN